MCALRAKNLYKELVSEGWRPGANIRNTQTFASLCEASATDLEGNAIEESMEVRMKEGRMFRHGEIHLGDDADGYRLRDLYENLVVDRHGEPVGSAFIDRYLQPGQSGSLMEAGAIGAVDSTAFAGVTGQLLVTEMLKPYENEEYMVRKMIPTYPSRLKQERIIGLAPPKDPNNDGLLVEEGQEFTNIGFAEQYIQTPLVRKYGKIIGLTKEAIFFDRTGDITKIAADLGDMLAFNEERECIGIVVGSTTDKTSFVEKRANDSAPLSLDIYQQAGAGSGSGQLAYAYPNRAYPWVNDIPSNPLQDYTSIRTCDQQFSQTVDPNRGRPIVVGRPYALLPHTKRVDIAQVLEAQSILKLTVQGVTTPGAILTNGPNPVTGIGMTLDRFAVSRLLQLEMVRQLGVTAAQAKDIWFYGDIARAFRYVENWPLAVVAEPPNSPAEFQQDIVVRWKASKQGRVACFEPRVIQRCNAISQVSSF